MRARFLPLLAVSAVVVPAMLGAHGALAAEGSAKQCIDANERSIKLRADHKLGAAREQLLLCTATGCPEEIRAECARRLAEVESAMPSIVLEAKDEAGNALDAVRVSLDGAPWLGKLDGKPQPLEPGEHRLTCQAEGRTAVEKKLVVAEGEQARRELVVFGRAAEAAPEPAGAPKSGPAPATGTGPAPEQPEPGRDPAWLAGGLVTAGLGLVGIVIGAVFGARASSQWSSSQSNCESAASCQDHAQAVADHDDAVVSANVSTAALVIGGAALVTGGIVFFAAPTVEPGPEGTTAGLTIGGAF
jgi:hypothetical protein